MNEQLTISGNILTKVNVHNTYPPGGGGCVEQTWGGSGETLEYYHRPLGLQFQNITRLESRSIGNESTTNV